MVTESLDTDRRVTRQESVSQNEILLKSGNTEVIVLPYGAMIASFKVAGVDILFPDQYLETEKGPKRRGGIPLLWPQAGPLTQKSDEFRLPQHGFARDKKWEVSNVSADNDEVTLKLTSSDETKKIYPYDFELEYTISVSENKLKAELKTINKSDKNLPMAPGFHPYFNIPADEKPNITTNIEGFNPTQYDWKSSQVYEMPQTVVVRHKAGEVDIEASPEVKTMIVWSEQESNSVCFEPWIGEVNALLDMDKRLEVPPGESKTISVQINYKPQENS